MKDKILNAMHVEMKRQGWKIEFEIFDLDAMADAIISAVAD